MTAAARPDLATVDAALERARELTMRNLKRPRVPARLRRRRPFVPRNERVNIGAHRRDERDERRQRSVDAGLELPWDETTRARFDAMYDHAETRAEKELQHCVIRELMAAKLHRVAAWAREHEQPEPEQFDVMAEKLQRARRVGYWGLHLDTGELVMRFRDRSGLTILDPSEARERQAELVRRLVPELQRLRADGLRFYYAVISEPNVGAGSLAWGKAHLFERFRRVILGRGLPGTGPMPEIVGAFAVQEDPLAADGRTWNVHLNLILVVDPRQCTPLDDDHLEQLNLELRGNAILKFPEQKKDPTPAGCMSYAKLHFLWGSDQCHVQPLEDRDNERLGKRLLEVIKYSAKFVTTKQLDELAAGEAAPRALASSELVETSAPFNLDGARYRGRGRPAAPGVTEWPEARVAEWIHANRRFRRVRGWGVLYRIAKEEREPDPDDAGRIRWLGRVFISPRGVVIHAARLSFVNSAHGDKFGRDFSGASGRSFDAQARASRSSARAVA